MRSFGFVASQRVKRDFLLVAAAEGAGGGFGAVGFHVEVADVIERELAFGAEAEPSAGENDAMNRHRHVGGDGHFENHAVTAAVFGHVGDAVGNGVLRRTDAEALTVQSDFAGVGGRDAEDDAGEFGPTGADESGQPDNFAGAHVEGHVADAADCATDVFQREDDFAGARFRAGG